MLKQVFVKLRKKVLDILSKLPYNMSEIKEDFTENWIKGDPYLK